MSGGRLLGLRSVGKRLIYAARFIPQTQFMNSCTQILTHCKRSVTGILCHWRVCKQTDGVFVVCHCCIQQSAWRCAFIVDMQVAPLAQRHGIDGCILVSAYDDCQCAVVVDGCCKLRSTATMTEYGARLLGINPKVEGETLV